MSNIAETWKSIAGFNSLYEVSDLGNVRNSTGKNRKLQVTEEGYVQVKLYKENKEFPRYVHRLVLETFVGMPQIGAECRHLDNNRQNNRLGNLLWGTSSQNKEDILKAGNNKQCKLTDEQVRYIRGLPMEEKCLAPHERKFKQVIKELEISEVTFYNVRRRKTYRHVL